MYVCMKECLETTTNEEAKSICDIQHIKMVEVNEYG